MKMEGSILIVDCHKSVTVCTEMQKKSVLLTKSGFLILTYQIFV